MKHLKLYENFVPSGDKRADNIASVLPKMDELTNLGADLKLTTEDPVSGEDVFEVRLMMPNGTSDLFKIKNDGEVRLQSGSWNHGKIDIQRMHDELDWSLVNLKFGQGEEGEVVVYADKKYKYNSEDEVWFRTTEE